MVTYNVPGCPSTMIMMALPGGNSARHAKQPLATRTAERGDEFVMSRDVTGENALRPDRFKLEATPAVATSGSATVTKSAVSGSLDVMPALPPTPEWLIAGEWQK